MKKTLLSLAMMFGLFVSAQETESPSSERQNDIMLSPIELVLGASLNLSYERLLNKDMGIGINGIFVFGDQGAGVIDTQISPYYRLYFGKKYASGFFVEAFVPITTSTDSRYIFVDGPGYFNPTYKDVTETTIGGGIGFGGKWVARRNIIFEASAGIARRFGSEGSAEATLKGMLGIGYRF